MRRAGYAPFLVVDTGEDEAFRERFGDTGQRALELARSRAGRLAKLPRVAQRRRVRSTTRERMRIEDLDAMQMDLAAAHRRACKRARVVTELNRGDTGHLNCKASSDPLRYPYVHGRHRSRWRRPQQDQRAHS